MSHDLLSDSDYRLLQLVWAHEPVGSGELVRLCREAYGWQKSTTYTQIKRLAAKGLVQNENATVTARVSREEVQGRESRSFVQRGFQGSLPGFVAAFLNGKTLSHREAEELRRLIDESEARHG